MTREELIDILIKVEGLPNWDTYDNTGLDNGVAIWFDTKEKEEDND